MEAPTETNIEGGPSTAFAAPEPTKPTTEPTETIPKAAFQPIFIGGRKFESAESLAAYTSELDRQRGQWEKERQFTTQATAASDPDKELADLVFEDTTTAVKLLTEKAERQALEKFEAKMAQERAVQSFYSKYEDLRNFTDLVDLTANRLNGKIREMPQEEAMELIAKEARSRIASIRGTPTGGTELPSGPARVASATGGPATPVQVTTETENLIDQIRRYQMRGKTKGGK